MKAIIKENGNKKILKEGNLEEIKKYVEENLDDLLDWLEEGNQWEDWGDFTGFKNGIKGKIINAENIEDLNQAFLGINSEMSYWGVFFE